MSEHTEKIASHGIHTNLEDVFTALEAVVEMKDNSPLAVETAARVKMIVSNFSASLNNCHRDLISIKWLDQSSSALSNIKSYLNNYKSNKDANTLNKNCSGQLDILLQYSTQLNCVKSTRSIKGVMAAQEEYLRIMDGQNALCFAKIKDLENEVKQLQTIIQQQDSTSKNNLQELQTSINNEKQRLDSFATSYQTQMASDQKEFVAMSDSLKKDFSTEQEQRKKGFEEFLEKANKQSLQIDENASIQAASIEKNSQAVIDGYKQKFEEYKSQVENIVGIVNTNMFSHKYKEVADDAHKRARFWHGVAIALILLVGGFAIYAFIVTVNEDTSWVKLIAKIFATTTLVSGAAYAARQASKQEKVERYARKIEMELVAIDPFISSLEEDKQSSIKEEISRKIFGNADAMEISNKDEPYAAMDKMVQKDDLLIQLLTQLLNKFSK